MAQHKTTEAVRLAGITRPTFMHRVRALKLHPKTEWGDAAHYWTDEQIALIANPPARCPHCQSPYHEVCYRGNRADRKDPDRWILSQKDS